MCSTTQPRFRQWNRFNIPNFARHDNLPVGGYHQPMVPNKPRIKVSAKGKSMAKKNGSSLAGENRAKKTPANVAGKVVLPVHKASAPKPATGKTYKVTLARAKGRGQTVFISAPGKVLEANTTLEPGKIVKLKLSRSNVVGKHPEVHHLPAPKAKLKLDDETRKSLLASMVLI
jgi:hypothetical protein